MRRSEPGLGEAVGIVGAGRLGAALAVRFAAAGREVVLLDRDVAVARAAAATARAVKGRGARVRWVRRPDQLRGAAGTLLLCVPPAEVERFLRRWRGDGPEATLLCNLATSLSTAGLRRNPEWAGLDLVALKPVGQFVALRYGVPALFVTEPREKGRLAALQELARPAGVVVLGDEDAVGRLNRLATLEALSTSLAFLRQGQGQGFSDALLEAALRNVFAGTILDFPPAADNGYAQELLVGLREHRVVRGGRA